MITQEQIEFEEVRALTWKEPFASLMLHGKTMETRPWRTNYRGLVLICSGRAIYRIPELREICGEEQLARLTEALWGISENTQGLAIAVARLADCWKMREHDEEKAFVKFNAGLWVHRYEDARAIIPFPFKGAQRWTILRDHEKKFITLV